MVRRTAEDTEATRAALVEAALFVFAERGFASATLAEVAARAGVTRGAVYHHFADKATLREAVLTEPWDALAGPAWTVLDSPGTLRERLTGFAEAWLTALREDPRFQALMTVSLEVAGGWRARGLQPGPATAKAAGMTDWHGRLTSVFTSARPELALGIDPPAAAAHVLAWLYGTALMASADPALLPPAGPPAGTAAFEGLLR